MPAAAGAAGAGAGKIVGAVATALPAQETAASGNGAAGPSRSGTEVKLKKKKKKMKKDLTICLSNCKYPLVTRCAEQIGFREVEEEESWNLQWIDTSVSVERVMRMKKFQKINHFPGTCRPSALLFVAIPIAVCRAP